MDRLKELMWELLKELLTDNLEIKISSLEGRIKVELTLFGETISSDSMYK